MKKFSIILKENREWNKLYGKRRNFITIWCDNKKWNKQYGIDMPEWALKDVTDSSVYTDPSYIQWYEKLSVEKKKEFGKKMFVMEREIGRLSDSIEDELMKRGKEPETSKL